MYIYIKYALFSILYPPPTILSRFFILGVSAHYTIYFVTMSKCVV